MKPEHYNGASRQGRRYLSSLLGEVTEKTGFFDGDLFSSIDEFIPELEGDAFLFSACKYFWRLGIKPNVSELDDLTKAKTYLLKSLRLREKWWFPLARFVAKRIAKKRIKKTLKMIDEGLAHVETD